MTGRDWSFDGRVACYTSGAGDVCEDLSNGGEHGAWVLDGSSGAEKAGVTDAPSDGRWFVERFDSFLQERLRADAPLPEIVRQGIGRMRQEFRTFDCAAELDVVELPLAAAAIARPIEDRIEFLLSADCDLVVRRRSGETELIAGDGPRALDAEVVNTIQRLKAESGLSHETAKDRTREMIVENRRQLNTPGGYWALSTDPRAVDHARCSTLDPRTVDRLAMFSDGFERLFELYDELSYADLFDLIDERGIEAPFDRLREIERTDEDCRRYPRIKPSDDATLAVVDVGSLGE